MTYSAVAALRYSSREHHEHREPEQSHATRYKVADVSFVGRGLWPRCIKRPGAADEKRIQATKTLPRDPGRPWLLWRSSGARLLLIYAQSVSRMRPLALVISTGPFA